MTRVTVGLLVILAVTLAAEASLYAGTSERRLQQYKYRNNILHEILIEEGCLTRYSGRSKRTPAEQVRVETQLEVEIKLYEELTTKLIECRQAKLNTTTTTTKTLPTTTKTTTQTTTTPKTTTTSTTTTRPTITTTPTPTTMPTTTTISLDGAVNLALDKLSSQECLINMSWYAESNISLSKVKLCIYQKTGTVSLIAAIAQLSRL